MKSCVFAGKLFFFVFLSKFAADVMTFWLKINLLIFSKVHLIFFAPNCPKLSRHAVASITVVLSKAFYTSGQIFLFLPSSYIAGGASVKSYC